jgi:surface antigen
MGPGTVGQACLSRARRTAPPILILLLCTACALPAPADERTTRLDPAGTQYAIAQAKDLRAAGRRVWCVPFARNLSGIDIKGNAKDWWRNAAASYRRGHQPSVGAVMAFSATRGMPLGHVAVVSKVVSPRQVLVNHANWERNRISLGMTVVDVSQKNDWSAVRVESRPGTFGRIYPVQGFILPIAAAQG